MNISGKMVDDPTFTQLKWDFLGACDLDYEGLWFLVDQIGETIPDEVCVKHVALQVLADLVGDGLLEPGFPEGVENPGPGGVVPLDELRTVMDGMVAANRSPWLFFPWGVAPGDALRRISAGWDALGHAPGYFDLAWFRITEKGHALWRKHRADLRSTSQ